MTADHTVHIERVVVSGLSLSTERQEALQRELASELERLLRERGWPDTAGGDREHRTAPPLDAIAAIDSGLRVTLPAASWNVVRLKAGGR